MRAWKTCKIGLPYPEHGCMNMHACVPVKRNTLYPEKTEHRQWEMISQLEDSKGKKGCISDLVIWKEMMLKYKRHQHSSIHNLPLWEVWCVRKCLWLKNTLQKKCIPKIFLPHNSHRTYYCSKCVSSLMGMYWLGVVSCL